MATQRKTKRKLTDISFDGADSHIALVHKDQGGPANGADYKLVIKNLNFSKEAIEKMQQVRVTLDLPDFLEKFFNIYGTNAQVLARMMGYVEPENEQEEYGDDWYENYIQEKLESFEILKSLKDTDSLATVLATLNEKEYLTMLQDQFVVEKALIELDKVIPQSDSEQESDTSNIMHEVNEPEVSVSKQKIKKEKQMTKPTTETKTVTVEMVEKSMLESLQKSLDDQKQELQKALDTINLFEQEKKAQIVKSKTSQFQALIKDEKVLAPVLKAALALESDEDFTLFLGAVTAMQAEVTKQKEQLEKSALFTEQGATVAEDSKEKESAVARILKANKAKQTETK
jgi:hypothetical protein